jgi:hypothetical protein
MLNDPHRAYARAASRFDERGVEEGRWANDLVRVALRLIVEVALEGEVERERYARGESENAGYWNGYRTTQLHGAAAANFSLWPR